MLGDRALVAESLTPKLDLGRDEGRDITHLRDLFLRPGSRRVIEHDERADHVSPSASGVVKCSGRQGPRESAARAATRGPTNH